MHHDGWEPTCPGFHAFCPLFNPQLLARGQSLSLFYVGTFLLLPMFDLGPIEDGG